MSLEAFTSALDALPPADLPQAARRVVMRLSDAELMELRIWAHNDEPKRRAAEIAKAEGAADAVRALRVNVPALAPKPAKIPAGSVYTGMEGVVAWSADTPYVPGDLVWSDGAVWQPAGPGPVSTRPEEGPDWWRVPAPDTDVVEGGSADAAV